MGSTKAITQPGSQVKEVEGDGDNVIEETFEIFLWDIYLDISSIILIISSNQLFWSSSLPNMHAA